MLEKIRVYSRITNLWSIARRYFVNNFYDGMLTVLGILLGFFALVVKDGQTVESYFVILTGVGSSISMFISGITGSYLSEKAEQKKVKEELNRAMIITEEKEEEMDDEVKIKEIEKAMLTKIGNNIDIKKNNMDINKFNSLKKKKKRTKNIQEKAETFASIIVSLVNGFSPFLGGLVPLIPFFYTKVSNFSTFITSFSIILICIISLGVFLGVVSKESILKNILQMVIAFALTLTISIFLLG
ncbi:MAG: VIT1/CCC1 transporter family protein [Candidatus Thorarchaeota archaeon]